MRRGSIQTSAVVAPTSLARRVRFDEGLRRLQDWDFYLRAAAAGAHFYAQPDLLTIHNADDDPARLSKSIDSDWLERWIAERRSTFSTREVAGFLANKVAPEAVLLGRRWTAARHLIPGIILGVVPPRNAAIEALRLVLPRRWFDAARKAARRS